MHAGANGRSGGEYQDITTVPGQKYLLTFWAVGWLNGPIPQTGLVQVGTPGSADNDATLNNNAEYVNAPIAVPLFTSAADWTEFAFTFTPATELTRVSFQNVSPSGGIAINIDDVSVFPATVQWVITTQLVNQSTLCSSNVTFTVGTDSTEPLNYQWYFNGATIPGAVEATLALNNVKASEGGNYFAVVKDNFQTATSAVARLTVNCVGGLIANGGFEALGDKGSQNNAIPLGWHEIVNSYGCWVAQAPAKPPHSGKYVMHAGASSGNGGEYQDVATVPGTTYLLDFWAVGWVDGAAVQSGIVQVGTPGSVDNDLSQNNNAEYVNVTFQVPVFASALSWTHLSYTFTAATETTRVTLQNVAPSAVNIDDVSLDFYRPGPVSISRTAQGYVITCPGIAGRDYQLQKAPTLSGPWTTVATVTAPEMGPVEFTDTEKPQPMAFYRVVLP
jgi:hypothetical protein